MSIISSVGGAAVFSSASGGKVTAVNNLDTTPAVVIGANTSRRKIVFHNPGTIDVYIAPSVDFENVAIDITTNRGGSFLVYANGGTLSIEGECQGAWQAVAASGADNPLTVMDSNV
jgi:hypothetical protein